MGQVGPRSRLTPEVSDKICKALMTGNYLRTAAGYAGVGESSIYQWLARGRKALEDAVEHEQWIPDPLDPEGDQILADDGIPDRERRYVEFLAAVEKAEIEAEIRMATQWSLAAAKDWRAAKEFLARRYPERWGTQPEFGFGGEPFQIGAGSGAPLEIEGPAAPIAEGAITDDSERTAAILSVLVEVAELPTGVLDAATEVAHHPADD